MGKAVEVIGQDEVVDFCQDTGIVRLADGREVRRSKLRIVGAQACDEVELTNQFDTEV